MLAACEGPASAPGTTVTVRDALDGRPVAGAVLRAAGQERVHRTDGRGRATLALGDAEAVHAVAPGYLGGSRRLVGAVEVEALELPLWPESPPEAAVEAHLARLERARVRRDDPSDPALRPEARARILGETPMAPAGEVGAVRAALEAPPETIRIWRRSLDGASASCEGRIDVIDFEEYVKGVLPHEWIASWHDESLRAGALAIRTYAWQWVRAGGKYDCADLDDTARSQVYADDRVDRASQAVDDTRGMAITRGGELVSGEYSAENGDPTAFGVEEPLCTGREVFGHGRGMCQWGSQRWALDGRDHLWIATHYYPDSTVEGGGPALPDYDASFVRLEAPDALRSGERAEVWVELRNEGRREWDVTETRLATSSPPDHESPFHDVENWFSATRPTPPDEPGYVTGDVGRFTFRVRAPEVAEPTDVSDTFRLVHGDTWFGPEVELTIRVRPREAPPPPSVDGGADAGGGSASDGGFGGGGGLTGGCSVRAGGGRAARPAAALPWLALLLGWARRRRAAR